MHKIYFVFLFLFSFSVFAQNEAIELKNFITGEGELDKETGIITWKKALQPKQNWKTRFSYTIKFPKDKRINLR